MQTRDIFKETNEPFSRIISICLILSMVCLYLISCNEDSNLNDASVPVDSIDDLNISDKHQGQNDVSKTDLKTDVDSSAKTDMVKDIGSCTCIPVTSWNSNWNTCHGWDVIWGCKNNPQKFGAWADIVHQCYSIETDKKTGCPMPKIICYKSCMAPPDMPTIPPHDMGNIDK